MAGPGDSICIRQTPHAAVPLQPPADHRTTAPAKTVAPGVAGHKLPPRPATPVPKLLVPGRQEKDPKKTEDNAEAACAALADAAQHLANAPPDKFGEAERRFDIARGLAEQATMHNTNVQRELEEERWANLSIASNALTSLEQELGDATKMPSLSAIAKLGPADNRVQLALNDVLQNQANVRRAQRLRAYAEYPNLAVAKAAFDKALHQLNGNDDVKAHLKPYQQAAVALRDAWAVARDAAMQGSDIELQKACKQGFAVAEYEIEVAFSPDFVSP